MAEYYNTKEIEVEKGEPIVFENKTDSSFDVSVGVVFRKSGLYEVSIIDKRVTVSKVGTVRSKQKQITNKAGHRVKELNNREKYVDCISRQAAINALGGEPMVWTYNDSYARGQRDQWGMDVEAIEKLPSAEPQESEDKE